MLLYNTYTKQKEEFKPVNGKSVTMYSCGPTVYDFAHIGNFRSYLSADFLRRTLEYLGYEVRHVKNITDVGHLTESDLDQGEDKINKKAKEKKTTPEEIARFFEKAFLEDEVKLNIEKADFYPRATAHIAEMIQAVRALLDKGYAYEKNGAVFFDVEKFGRYGKLSGNALEKLKLGQRVKHDSEKKHSYDFYLWRPAAKDHLMKWPSPWGEGYPGWHIECTVMSRKFLGDTIDIHSGGEDNIFPHHENEIAQSEALTDRKFVNIWFHSRHLLIKGEKMAKSKGSFYTLADLEKKNYNPLVFRMLAFSSHYRSTLDFSFETLDQAAINLEKIKELLVRLQTISDKKIIDSTSLLAQKAKADFKQALENDLDSPKALAVILGLVKNINTLIDKNEINQAQAKAVYDLMIEFDKVLGLSLAQTEDIPEEITNLAAEREKMRKEKKWKEADEIRKKIEKKGYEISDSEGKTVIRKK